MATINLTTGDDDILVEAPLSSLLVDLSAMLAGETVDALDGFDSLAIDTSIVVDTFTLAMSSDGTLSLTTIDGTASFVNFEQLVIEGVVTLLGTSAGEAMTGTADADLYLFGLAGDDTLDGKAGADKMHGGLGDDTYYVDNAGDVVVEAAGEGTDTIISSVTITLGANVENATLTGFTSINATGNALANTLTGNDTSNVLDGGLGADTMKGGKGADAYFVDNAGDTIVEKALEGIDTVSTTVNYSLANNVENLVLLGTVVTGTGNNLNNIITGNAGNNIIDGGLGLDTMRGGLGNDIYYVNQTTDVVTEIMNQGNDTVRAFASFTIGPDTENLVLMGTAAINGYGGSGNSTITGNSAANILAGGLGRDVITGGGGADMFDYNTNIDSRSGGATRDLITDFTHLVDHIDLSTIDADGRTAGNQAFLFLGARGAQFTGRYGELRYLASGTDTLIEGDINGDKTADFQIQLTGNKVLTVADFIL